MEGTGSNKSGFKISGITGGLAKVGQGLRGGVSAVEKAGQGLIGGAKVLQQGVDSQLERTGGFEFVKSEPGPSSRPQTRGSDRPKRVAQFVNSDELKRSFTAETARSNHAHSTSGASQESTPQKQDVPVGQYGNTTRKFTNSDDMFAAGETHWWQFWKPPSGAYASPVPQGGRGGRVPVQGCQ